jgi:hypothetical protein
MTTSINPRPSMSLPPTQSMRKPKTRNADEVRMAALPFVIQRAFTSCFGFPDVANQQLRDFIVSLGNANVILKQSNLQPNLSRIRVFARVCGENGKDKFDSISFYLVLHFLRSVIAPSFYCDPALLGDGQQTVLVSRLKFERAARTPSIDIVPFRSQPTSLPGEWKHSHIVIIGTSTKIEHIENPFATSPGLVSKVMDDCSADGHSEVVDLDLALEKLMNLYWGVLSATNLKKTFVGSKVKVG